MPRRIVLSLAVVFALGLVAVALSIAETGPGEVTVDGDGAIEDQFPRAGDRVLRQAEVGIDLAAGWTGTLTVNGVAVPDAQARRNDPLNQVWFRPGKGKVVDTWRAGSNCIEVQYWRSIEGPSRARLVRWCFEAA